jgi:bacterioferritin-associated ferredoxin
VKQGIVMPGGWNFMQPFNGTQVKIEAGSYLELLEAVQIFRNQNHIQLGNTEKDVEDQICSNFPQQCHVAGRGTPITPIYGATTQNRFVDRITDWIKKVRGNPQIRNLVNKETANRRAEHCIKCQENMAWQNSCATCIKNAQSILAAIREGRGNDTPYWSMLHGCGKQGWDNRTAVWLPRQMLADEGVPPNCWMKKEGM